jgi:predicted molibdopterin-dependent oxidoreductase YjgC
VIYTGETFAAYITVCAECGVECQMLVWDGKDGTVTRPCGHAANLTIIDNPKLRKAS